MLSQRSSAQNPVYNYRFERNKKLYKMVGFDLGNLQTNREFQMGWRENGNSEGDGRCGGVVNNDGIPRACRRGQGEGEVEQNLCGITQYHTATHPPSALVYDAKPQ